MTVIKNGASTFEADSLMECVPFLKEQGVRFVRMIWTWNKVIEIDVPDRWPFTHHPDLKARYVGREIDNEYSFVGEFIPEAFAEWAEGYGCWDGAELVIADDTLKGHEDGYNGNADEFPEDDEKVRVIEWESLELVGYLRWDRKASRWRLLA